MLHLRLASRLYIRSHGGGRSLADDLDDFGNVWYVSRRNAVISSNRIQAKSLSAMGHSIPYRLTLASSRKSSSSSSIRSSFCRHSSVTIDTILATFCLSSCIISSSLAPIASAH